MLGAEIGSLWRSMVHLRTGALSDAEADARRVIDGARESRWQFGLIAATHFLGEVLLERGELDAARQLYGVPRELPRRGWASIWAYGVAKVEFAGGHAREALDALLDVGRREDEFVADRPWMLPWRSAAAVAAVTAGEPELALRLAEKDVEVARTFGRPRPVGVSLRARGIVRGGSEGIADLTEAVELLAESPARLEHARALIDLGALVRRGGDRAAAREHLTMGLDRASRCGAAALAERARSELQATGVRPRRERMSGPAALTGSELRVARLAASGASNREIAQTLFVTQKTVEKHLANSYSKLEIPSRERLGGGAGRGVGLHDHRNGQCPRRRDRETVRDQMDAKWIIPTAFYVLAVGGLGVVNKLSLRTLEWPTLVLWTGIGYIAVTAVLLIRGDATLSFERGTGWAILGAGLAIGGLIAINIALTHGKASQVIPITAAYPALTLVLAAAVLSEPITLVNAAGTALIVAGVVLISVAS